MCGLNYLKVSVFEVTAIREDLEVAPWICYNSMLYDIQKKKKNLQWFGWD